MKLLALNKKWAIYDPRNANEKCDTFSALQALLQVKTYNQLIAFLETYTCNTLFATDSDTDFDDAFNRDYNIWRSADNILNLQGNLNGAINRCSEVDFLDELVVKDLTGKNIYQLFLPELIDFRDTICRFLKYAAVALGSPATENMFLNLDTALFFDEKWLEKCLERKLPAIKTIGFPQEYIGACHDGLLDDYAFDSHGIFHHLDGYSKWQLVIDNSVSYGKYTDGYPFSIDEVIYNYEEICDDAKLLNENYYLAVSFFPNISTERAQMLLAGRAVEALLELGNTSYNQNQFSIPHYNDIDLDDYAFIPGKGFVQKTALLPKWWVNELFEQTISLILDGKVSLCPVCGTPVLIKDYRGRKSKQVCSDSCKTKASNKRREKAYQYAAAGMPIKEAIKCIGAEYEHSIQKWYKEANSFLSV